MKIDFDIKKMPKVELHLHLDGSVRVSTLEEYAKRKVKQEVIAPDKCINLGDYLTKFSLPVQFLQTKKNLKRACYELSQDLEEDGVIYAEVRFSPIKLATSSFDLEEIVETVILGFQEGNVPVNLILCMMRNDNYDTNLKVIEVAEKFLKRGVVALDLAGDETCYPTSSFQKIFSIINQKKIPFTIHAGEIDKESSIISALQYGAKRLGHGIHAIHYPKIMNNIKENNVLLEICPTSNVQTNTVAHYIDHPIQKLKKEGCLLSINTDNRTVSNITLTEEYQKLIDTFGFTKEDFCNFNLNAINYSFLEDEKKEKYKKIVKEYLNL